MPNTTSISVVIPAYNAGDTLSETLDSVADQIRAPDEVIVVDDGSTDGTCDIVINHSIGAKLLKQANKGAASAINNGIEAARSKFVALLDADDLWTPNKLQIQEEALTTGGANHIILGHVEAFECPSQSPDLFRGLSYVKGKVPGYLPGAVLVRRDLVAAPGNRFDPSLKTGYFIDWFRRARSAGVGVVMLDGLVLRRRIRINTLSRRDSSANDALSRDFLEVARRAIEEKRQRSRTG